MIAPIQDLLLTGFAGEPFGPQRMEVATVEQPPEVDVADDAILWSFDRLPVVCLLKKFQELVGADRSELRLKAVGCLELSCRPK